MYNKTSKEIVEQKAEDEKLSMEKWNGTYTHSDETGQIDFSLNIKSDSCTYEGVGRQTWFKVLCKVKLNNDRFEIYWKRNLEGAFLSIDRIDKSQPIMTLYYKDGILYTDEGQLNKQIKGGQLLFKKTE